MKPMGRARTHIRWLQCANWRRRLPSRSIRSNLVFLSRWITPDGLPRRYDTWFFLAAIPEPIDVAPVTAEITEAEFVVPSTALAAHQAHHWKLVLPTLTHLQWLARHSSASVALASAPPRSTEPIQPKLAPDGSIVEFDLPW